MQNVSSNKLKHSALAGLSLSVLLITSACSKSAETLSETTEAATASGAVSAAATAVAPEGFASATAKEESATAGAPAKVVTPYRTFVTVQRYTLEKSGNPSGSISNARIEITFPNGGKLPLPEGGQYWPIGDGQVQEINRTYEIPWNLIQQDGFKFKVQMVRKGSPMHPCEFDVRELSQFNRTYICKTDIGWQTANGIAEDRQAVEGIMVRVFSDKNSEPKDIPREAIAANK